MTSKIIVTAADTKKEAADIWTWGWIWLIPSLYWIFNEPISWKTPLYLFGILIGIFGIIESFKLSLAASNAVDSAAFRK